MNTKIFLKTTILSTLLLTSTLSAQGMTCKGGKCFIDISKLSPAKSTKSKIDTFKNLKSINFTTTNISDDPSSTIVLEHEKYIMSENEKSNYLLNNEALYNDEDTIVLEHEKYVMTEAEKETYNMNERLKQAELEQNLMVPMITFEDENIEEIILPHSEFYCDNSKQATFYPESNEYECV